MRITSKGQVTIPKEIRDRLGLLPGTEVEFIERNGRAEVGKLPGGRHRGDEIVDRMRSGSGGDVAMTTDEIMALTRGEN